MGQNLNRLGQMLVLRVEWASLQPALRSQFYQALLPTLYEYIMDLLAERKGSRIAMLVFELKGQLPSGKNQVQLLWRNGRMIKYPNKTFKSWREAAVQQLQPCPVKPLTEPVELTCCYWPGDLRTRDVSGQLDAIFHLLVYGKVLEDDGLVHNVSWKREELDRKNPRLVVSVKQVNHG